MRREILELQRKLKLTTIFVTHDQEEANTTSDRIAVLDQGIIQQVGPPVELYDEPVNRFVADFLGTANLIEGSLQTQDGTPLFEAKEGRMAMFRPQDLTTQPSLGAAGSESTFLAGQVEHREFLGNLVRYTVLVGEHGILVDDSHQAGRPVFDVGDNVVLVLAVDQVRFFSD
jgi:iron(III) transport system ATP-binding protein